MKYYLVEDGHFKPDLVDEKGLRKLSWDYECLDLKDNMKFYEDNWDVVMDRVECLRDCVYSPIDEVIDNLRTRDFKITIIECDEE